jgi:DNA-binding transcriptional regulator YdaS (Cro superfamily)
MLTLWEIHEGGDSWGRRLMEAAHIEQASDIQASNIGQVINIRQAITRAVAILGSEVKLAAACGVTQPAISKAKLRGRISPRLALAVDRATNGRVPASDLRPDLWRSPENVPLRNEE